MPIPTFRVLLIEEEPGVAAIAQRFLESPGYRATHAKNGPEALAIPDGDASIDILFTDVMLPGGMNGREIADAALAQRPKLRVLFASGYPEEALSDQGRLRPGVTLVQKPYRKQDLAQALARVSADQPAEDSSARRSGNNNDRQATMSPAAA
jgi:CheY-like chemotaxis protein